MKNYKIIRICSANPYIDLFENYYAKNCLDELSYAQALKWFQEKGFLTPGSWSECMRQLGNESIDIVPDFMSLQKQWARENGEDVDFTQAGWSAQCLFDQIKTIKPDIIFFYAGGFYTMPADARRHLKERFPFVKLVTGLWGDSLGSSYSVFSDLDMLFCADIPFVEKARAAGIKAHLIRNCFDHLLEKIVENEGVSGFTNDFIFAGHSGYRYNDHRERYLDLIKLMQNSVLKVWCWEPVERSGIKRKNEFFMRGVRDVLVSMLETLSVDNIQRLRRICHAEGENTRFSRIFEDASRKHKGQEFCNWWHDKRPICDLFPSRCFAPVYGLDYYRLLKGAKIVFNRHVDEKGYCGNIRMFEATGLGACLVTDRKKESARFFNPDDEIVTYDSIDECIEKVRYLLDHDSVREKIASAGKCRTIKDHTVMNRCREINNILEKML